MPDPANPLKIIVNARGPNGIALAGVLQVIAHAVDSGAVSGKGQGWSFLVQEVKSRKKKKETRCPS